MTLSSRQNASLALCLFVAALVSFAADDFSILTAAAVVGVSLRVVAAGINLVWFNTFGEPLTAD